MDKKTKRPQPVKQIFAVSLDSPNKHRAAAMLFEDNRLFISHCLPISTRGNEWRDNLREEISQKASEGFVIIIEDRSGIFSPHAHSFCFDDVHEGRTMLQHAFDWWFSLQNSGNLKLDEDLKRYAINANSENALIELKTDDKGRVLYAPDWKSFTGGHKALLLCVVAAMMEPLSQHWFDAFMEAMPELPKEEWNITERWGKAMKNWENEEQLKLEHKREDRQAAIDRSVGQWQL